VAYFIIKKSLDMELQKRLSEFLRMVALFPMLLGGTLLMEAQSLSEYGWAFEFPDSLLYRVVTGPEGAVYCGGEAGEFRLRGVSYPSSKKRDIVVVKILPSGALAWVKRFGGGVSDNLNQLSFDEAGFLIVSGREDGVGDRCWVVDASGRTVATLDENCTNRVALDSGQGFVQPTGSIFSNGFNVFSADGQFVWGRKTHSLLVRSVRGLADGTFIAIGEVEKHFEKGRIGKNGKIPDQDEEWVEIRGPVVARFANDGELIWAKSAEDPVVVGGGFFGGGIDENGNAIYGGHFRNVLRLGNHRFDTGGDPDGFMNNGFLVSWDGNGNVKWAKHLASDSGSIVTSIAVSRPKISALLWSN
jgi:hypothetical protein